MLVAIAFGIVASVALADAPDGSDAKSTLNGGPVNPAIDLAHAFPVETCSSPGTSIPASICTANPNAVKVTVAGGWVWYTHGSDCNTDRAGVGVAIDWGDRSDLTKAGNGNPITTVTYTDPTTSQKVTRLISVGVATADGRNPVDNVVHPTPRTTSQYGTGSVDEVTSPSLYKSWRGACGNVTSAQPKLPRGTWGKRDRSYNGTAYTTLTGNDAQGLSHIYASRNDVSSICVVTYDVHKGTAPSGNNGVGIPSGAGEITAGGSSRNSDNGVEKNSGTPLGNACPTVPLPRIKVEKLPHNQTVPLLGTANWTIVVTNIGNTDLTNVQIGDQVALNCAGSLATLTGGSGNLAKGASASYGCFFSNVTAPGLTNVVTACGDQSGATPTNTVCDSDSSTLTARTGNVGIEDLSSNQDFIPNDRATLTGAITPAGTLTFTLWKDACGTGGTQLLPPSSQTLDANNSAATANTSTLSSMLGASANTAGTYYWQVAYSGDVNTDLTTRNAAFSECNESFIVSNG